MVKGLNTTDKFFTPAEQEINQIEFDRQEMLDNR